MAKAVKAEWPADHVERRNVETLIPSARNARLHSERHVRLVDEAGEIIAGHGRMLAARHLGLATVPVMVARGGQPARSALPREQT